MLQKLTLIGRLGAAVDIVKTQQGEIGNASIAVTEKYYDRNKNPKEHTEWLRLTIYENNLNVFKLDGVGKGTLMYIEGRMRSTKKEKDGQSITYWNVLVDRVQLLGGPNQSAPQNNQASQSNEQRAPRQEQSRSGYQSPSQARQAPVARPSHDDMQDIPVYDGFDDDNPFDKMPTRANPF